MGKLKKHQIAALVFFALTLLSSVLNIGFIGTDEYTEGIARYLPAQKATWDKLVQSDDVKSPTQIFTFHVITKTLLNLGATSPEIQYRGLIFTLGLISALLIALAIWIFASTVERDRDRFFEFVFYYFSFHFALIGLLARPMFEALSMPLVFLALICGHAYDLKQNRKILFLGVLAGSLAFCVRPQTGAINLVFFFIPLLHRRWWDLLSAGFLGTVFFVLAGIPDIFLRGQFHYSLRAVFSYNLAHGQSYNPQPWWFYFPIVFLVIGGLFLFAHYSKNTWAHVMKMRSLWLGTFLFLAVHLIFQNKFERFLIPLVPTLLLLAMPLWQELWLSRRQRLIRWGFVLVFNFTLWPVIGFFTPQSNIIDLCFYLNSHQSITSAQMDSETFSLFPDAFIERGLRIQSLNRTDILKALSIESTTPSANEYWILSKSDYTIWRAEHPGLRDRYLIEVRFEPNLIEKLAFRLNPLKNFRRQTIFLVRHT